MILRVCALSAVICGSFLSASSVAERSRNIQYADLSPALQRSFAAAGISEQTFPAYLRQIETDTNRRVAEGDREHLIHYALQSVRFTTRPRIEPALSARQFVDHLSDDDRRRLLADSSYVPRAGWPAAERARVEDLLSALRKATNDARLALFREIARSDGEALRPAPSERLRVEGPEALYRDYVRVARFLYLKEFVSGRDAAQIAELYHTRPHSSDTQIDAGFAVSTGFGVLHALEPALRVQSVLVVGPGLDLAPRTDLIDAADPQSYQPFAVADALLALGLATERDLRVHSVDVNPRVVRSIQAAARGGMTLHVFSGLAETAEQPFSQEYRSYVRALGRTIGDEVKAPGAISADRHYQHSIAVRVSIANASTAERLNVITQRLVDRSFDVIVATNVLTYFDDRELALALSSILAMLRPGGYLLHNENRGGLAETAAAVGLPAAQMRTVILGGPKARPLYDIIWLHRRTAVTP